MRRPVILLLGIWTCAASADPGITIIGHRDSELGQLTRKQVADIYMGRVTSLPNNSIPLPLDYQGESAVRTRFYQAITGKSLAQINAYWARLSFTGQANPPRKLPDQTSIRHVVEKNQDALGYVEGDVADPDVTPLLTIP